MRTSCEHCCRCAKDGRAAHLQPGAGQACSSPPRLGKRGSPRSTESHRRDGSRRSGRPGLGMLTMQRLPLPAAPPRLAPGAGESQGTEHREEPLPSACPARSPGGCPEQAGCSGRQPPPPAWRGRDATACTAAEMKHKLPPTPPAKGELRQQARACLAETEQPPSCRAGAGWVSTQAAEITAPGDAFTSRSGGSCLSLQSPCRNRQSHLNSAFLPCPAPQREETPGLPRSETVGPKAGCQGDPSCPCPVLSITSVRPWGGDGQQEGNYTASPPPGNIKHAARGEQGWMRLPQTSGRGTVQGALLTAWDTRWPPRGTPAFPIQLFPPSSPRAQPPALPAVSLLAPDERCQQ